jgi:micrococcal nuclease
LSNVIKFSKKKKSPNPKSGSAHNRPKAWAAVVTALAVVAAVFYHPSVGNVGLTGSLDSAAIINADAGTQKVHFTSCVTGGGTNCVVDGDTFWFGGEKIRISDIDAPETHPPHCQIEAELGRRATIRLQELLNAGPFELEADDRDHDQYGRKLRVVTQGSSSVGLQLVSEGLARRWDGGRKPWC